MQTTATVLDYTIIVLYFVFVLGIGVYLKKFTTTGKDFFLAGRRNSAWVAGLAFLAANMGALELLGMAGNTYKYGTLVAHFYWIGAIPAMLFLAIFMMPFYYSSRIHSVPGYLKLRFDERNRTLNAIAFGVMTLLVSGINLYAMALVLHTIVGWNFHVCIWLSMITVTAYVALGGLTSAIFNEIIQFFLIWGGLLLLPILGIVEIGGWDAVWARVPDTMSHVWATTGSSSSNSMVVDYMGIVLGLAFVLSFGYWTTDFLVVQRAFSAKDLRAAISAPVIATFPKMAIPFIVCMAGIVALVLFPGQLGDANDPNFQYRYDEVLPLLIARYFPPGLMGLGITALMAGFMSGQAGNISAFNTIWTYDLYRAHINKNASDSHYLMVGRWATVVGMLISVATAYWAMSMSTIMDWMQAIFTWVNAPLFATILLGMFWKRCTSAGAFWGLLIGMVSSFVMWFLIQYGWLSPAVIAFDPNASDMAGNFWRAWWAWLVTFGLTILISLRTAPKTHEELQGLVYGLTPKMDMGDIPALRRPTFWAVIPIIILVILNLLFW